MLGSWYFQLGIFLPSKVLLLFSVVTPFKKYRSATVTFPPKESEKHVVETKNFPKKVAHCWKTSLREGPLGSWKYFLKLKTSKNQRGLFCEIFRKFIRCRKWTHIWLEIRISLLQMEYVEYVCSKYECEHHLNDFGSFAFGTKWLIRPDWKTNSTESNQQAGNGQSRRYIWGSKL